MGSPLFAPFKECRRGAAPRAALDATIFPRYGRAWARAPRQGSGISAPCGHLRSVRTSGMRRLLSLVILSTVVLGRANAQTWPGRVARLNQGGIEVLDSATGAPRRITGDTALDWLTDLSVAPGGGRVGVVQFERGPSGADGQEGWPTAFTVVFDAISGRQTLRIRDGLSFLWCGSDCIAVLYGLYSENSEGGPSGDSLDVFRASTGERSFVTRSPHLIFDGPQWWASDSTIVADGFTLDAPRAEPIPGIRIDLRSGSVRVAPVVLGIPSASGRFVIRSEYGESHWVAQSSDSLHGLRHGLPGKWQVEEWLGKSDKILLLFIPPRRPPPPGTPGGVRPRTPSERNAAPPERTYRVWDVATGRVGPEWKAAETGWRGPAPNGCRLFLKDGRLTAAPGCR